MFYFIYSKLTLVCYLYF